MHCESQPERENRTPPVYVNTGVTSGGAACGGVTDIIPGWSAEISSWVAA